MKSSFLLGVFQYMKPLEGVIHADTSAVRQFQKKWWEELEIYSLVKTSCLKKMTEPRYLD